jgi:FkbM family methyltransferase
MANVKSADSAGRLRLCWQDFRTRCYFKFVLPRVQEVRLEDLRLDVSALSLTARNRLLNVGYEIPERQMCGEFLAPDDSVLELGAGIGFIALFCQKKLGVKDYIACEANPRTFELLRRNYALNGVDSAIWNLALAPTNGQIELEVSNEFWEHSLIRNGDSKTGRKTTSVPAARFDTLMNKAGGKPNTLIIDVEGAEQFIEYEQIPDRIEKIIMELHPRIIGVERTYDIVARLIHQKFRVLRETEGTFAFVKVKQSREKRSLVPEACLSDAERLTRSSPRVDSAETPLKTSARAPVSA